MTINKNYKVSEGNLMGGQEPQAFGVDQKLITASIAVTKGMLVEPTGNFTVGPAADGSVKVCGIAFNDAGIGEKVVIDGEGFVKLSASNAVIVAGDKVISAGGGYVKKLPALIVSGVSIGTTVSEVDDALNQVINWALVGQAVGNTNNGFLYWNLTGSNVQGALSRKIELYKDAAKTPGGKVATGEIVAVLGTMTTQLLATAHGLVNTDIIVNFTRASAVRIVTKVDNNILTHDAVVAQAVGDTIKRFTRQADAPSEAGTNGTNVKITAHGMSVGDYIRNATHTNSFKIITAIVDPDNFTVGNTAGQVQADTIELYKSTGADVIAEGATNTITLAQSNASGLSGTVDVAWTADDTGAANVLSLDVSLLTMKVDIEAALANLAAVCGIAISGCDANGNPYIKFTL